MDVAGSSRIASDDEWSLNPCYGLHNGLTRTLSDLNAAVTPGALDAQRPGGVVVGAAQIGGRVDAGGGQNPIRDVGTTVPVGSPERLGHPTVQVGDEVGHGRQ